MGLSNSFLFERKISEWNVTRLVFQQRQAALCWIVQIQPLTQENVIKVCSLQDCMIQKQGLLETGHRFGRHEDNSVKFH